MFGHDYITQDHEGRATAEVRSTYRQPTMHRPLKGPPLSAAMRLAVPLETDKGMEEGRPDRTAIRASIARKKPLIAQRPANPTFNRRSSGPPANYAKPPASTHLSH